MEYVIADRNNSEAYWFERGFRSLEAAQARAKEYAEAEYILEYGLTQNPKGVVPTGRAWKLKELT